MQQEGACSDTSVNDSFSYFAEETKLMGVMLGWWDVGGLASDAMSLQWLEGRGVSR